MTARLAVIANDLGASFINFHANDLAPGRTVVVGRYGSSELGNLWRTSCPELLFEQLERSISARVARRARISEQRIRERAVERFLRRHGVDVVLGEYMHEFVEFVPLLEGMRVPYVVQAHGVDVSAALRTPGNAERYMAYRSARAILTRSEFHRQRLVSCGLPADKVHVNRGGVEIPAVIPERALASRKRFLAIGRFAPKKGPFYLLEAFRRAAERDPEITLDYVGGGPLKWAAQQFVDAANLRTRLRIHGSLPEPEKLRLLQECAVFVQHSVTDADTGDEEGLPAAIQEAMGHGLAVVSTRHAGIPEAVAHGETGLLVDERDVDAMADAFLRVADTAVEMGREGHRRALTEHSWAAERDRLSTWLFGPHVD